MSSDTLTRQDERTITGDRPSKAHYVRGKAALNEAIVLGKEIEALCGYRWIPSRDPEGLPVCEKCKAIASGEAGQ